MTSNLGNLKPEVTPHTYQVKEISMFEYLSALAIYLQQKQSEAIRSK